MNDWRLGTMGFGYDDWSGPFYPPGLKTSDRLSYYARHFNAVELDTTFHAAPDVKRVRHWAASVPEDFRFAVKAPRAVTHDAPLERAVAPMRAFLETCREFGPKLGAVLLQFAPSFTFEQAGKLEAFLAALPRDVPLAVELRNRTWGTQRTLDLLRANGCCLVMAEYLNRPRRVLVTSDFLYVRWIGEHGRYADHHTHERETLDENLAWWKAALEPVAPTVRSVLGFFNNDYTGYAIATCNRFKALIGQPVHEPAAARQGDLFS